MSARSAAQVPATSHDWTLRESLALRTVDEAASESTVSDLHKRGAGDENRTRVSSLGISCGRARVGEIVLPCVPVTALYCPPNANPCGPRVARPSGRLMHPWHAPEEGRPYSSCRLAGDRPRRPARPVRPRVTEASDFQAYAYAQVRCGFRRGVRHLVQHLKCGTVAVGCLNAGNVTRAAIEEWPLAHAVTALLPPSSISSSHRGGRRVRCGGSDAASPCRVPSSPPGSSPRPCVGWSGARMRSKVGGKRDEDTDIGLLISEPEAVRTCDSLTDAVGGRLHSTPAVSARARSSFPPC